MSVVTDDESSSQEKAEVFYVDYGNTELMPIDRFVRQFNWQLNWDAGEKEITLILYFQPFPSFVWPAQLFLV